MKVPQYIKNAGAKVKEANPTVLVVGGLAVTGVGYFGLLKPYLDERKRKNDLAFEQKQNKDFKGAIIGGKRMNFWYNLRGEKINSANLATIASDLNGALHPGWYKPTDQDRAVRVFLSTPAGAVKSLEEVYSKMDFGNLKKDLSDKLSDINFIKIKPYFSGIHYEIKGL